MLGQILYPYQLSVLQCQPTISVCLHWSSGSAKNVTCYIFADKKQLDKRKLLAPRMFRRKNVSENVSKSHFATINSKIQNKYEQMQKKIKKSRSVDSLAVLNDDFVFVQAYSVNNDQPVKEADSAEDKPPVTFNCVVDDVRDDDSVLQDATESYLSYSEMSLTDTEKKIEKFFDDGRGYFLTTSLESLNSITENDESLPPPSPTQKTTTRNKIGSRIAAAKEKRKEKKKESVEKVEKFILSNTTRQEIPKLSKKNKQGTVTIALIESTGLDNETTDEKPRMMSCRFRLGSEKFKSKPVKSNAPSVKWQELFNINLYEDNMLEISLWEKDIFLGRSLIDLSKIEIEKTHKMHLDLEGTASNIKLFVLLTISGMNLNNAALEIDDYDKPKSLDCIQQKPRWYHLKDDYTDVGSLQIFVYGAKGLSANDCYCVLELNNDRLQTYTDFKTSDPNWMKIFTFTVTDITSLLQVTVFDEKKSEAAGTVTIPLLKIYNGEKKWYALKESMQRERAKGSNPRILLEMRVTWNLTRASIRVLNPKESKYLEPTDKLDRHIFTKNLSRARAVVSWIMDAFKVIKSCFEWESRKWNLIALAVWLVMCSIFRVWMLPLLLLVPFVWYRPENYFLFYWRKYFMKDETAVLAEHKIEKEEKTSLRQKINSLQEMVQLVQNVIGEFASYGESVKNLFNFTVPFLSCLAIAILLVISLLMFLIPVKYMFMFWGIHKFTRKILRPNRIPNNELLDLLSRVPDDEILLDCQELLLEETSDSENIK